MAIGNMESRANRRLRKRVIVNAEIRMRCSSLDHTKEILTIVHIITITIATTATISKTVVLVEEMAVKGVKKEGKAKVLTVKILLTF